MNKLLIVDGNAIVHRAFHAFPPLTTPDGKLVQAVYGFFSMLIKVIEEIKPTHVVVTFDRPAPTFRKTMYAGYQAKRPPMADGMPDQFVMLHEALNEIGIPIFEVDGYEADDVIGTLSVQAKQEGMEAVILSGDRDLLQLVNSHVKVLAPIVGITKFTLFDEVTVEEKYGIKASQFIDYKSLVGDGSDGYPGVSGIGPKTAAELLKEYKTLENLYKNLALLPEKTSSKLATDAEQAALCKQLATIALDAPVHLELEKADLNNFTREKVTEVFDGFGFNTIKKRLGVFRQAISEQKTVNRKKNMKSENQLELI